MKAKTLLEIVGVVGGMAFFVSSLLVGAVYFYRIIKKHVGFESIPIQNTYDGSPISNTFHTYQRR